MAAVRVCSVFVLLLCINLITAKPFLGFLLCDWYCDDDDVTSTTTSTSDEWGDYFDWCDCRPRNRTRTTAVPPTTRVLTPSQLANPQRITLRLESGREISINYGSNDGMLISMDSANGGAAPTGSSTAAPPAGTTAAGATTAGTTAATTAATTTAAA